jgi:hypothetical protein
MSLVLLDNFGLIYFGRMGTFQESLILEEMTLFPHTSVIYVADIEGDFLICFVSSVGF